MSLPFSLVLDKEDSGGGDMCKEALSKGDLNAVRRMIDLVLFSSCRRTWNNFLLLCLSGHCQVLHQICHVAGPLR